MSNVAASSPDIAALVTNLGVFSLAVAAAVGGIWKGIKSIKKEANSPPEVGKVAQAMIVESTTMLMWSESNRSVCEAMHDMTNELRELRHELELDRVAGGIRR